MLEPARDVSLIPDYEVDLVALAITDDLDHELVFATIANFVQTYNGFPLILQVKSDSDFYEGQAAPSSTVNILREANVLHSIPVKGRLSWHFKRVSGTTTIKGKLLIGTATFKR